MYNLTMFQESPRVSTCVQCGYDLRGLADQLRCPECGTQLDSMDAIVRRNCIGNRLANDCAWIASRDLILAICLCGTFFALRWDWRAGLGLMFFSLTCVDFLFSILRGLDYDPLDFFDYLRSRKQSFRDAAHLLLDSNLSTSTRRRVTFWLIVGRTLVLMQALILLCILGLGAYLLLS